jgi:beta-xylosidase
MIQAKERKEKYSSKNIKLRAENIRKEEKFSSGSERKGRVRLKLKSKERKRKLQVEVKG